MTMSEKLIASLKTKYGLVVAELAADEAIQAAYSFANVSIKGRDELTGLPRTLWLAAREIVLAVQGD